MRRYKLNTKTSLASELGISRTTMHTYCNIAENHTDFEMDYPSNGDTVNRKAPLTDYQCWFLTKLFGVLMTKRYLRHHVENDFLQEGVINGLYHQFTKECYENQRNPGQGNNSPNPENIDIPLITAELLE